MLRGRVRRSQTVIPRVATVKQQTKDYEFIKGWNSNLSNDDVPQDQLRYITDAREVEIGKWQTRLGNDFFSVPIGEAVNAEQTSTTGAADVEIDTDTTRLAKPITATTTGPVTKIEVRIKSFDGTAAFVAAIFTDDSGEPGEEIFRTTIAPSVITGSYGYVAARSITCPEIENGEDYWVVVFCQDGLTGSYAISSTTAASTALSSADGGITWAALNADLNVKVYTATAGGVKGVNRLKRPNSTKYSFMAHGTNLYSINEVDGSTSSVDSGLHGSSTFCRFAFVNDEMYYVTGLQKPRKYNFTAATEVSSAPEIASNIIEHKGLLFYVSALDPTKIYWTNFGAYDTFTSTDFLYVPAPETADDITALFRLNGVMYICTRNNKYQLFGSQTATFQLSNAIGQKGTFTQESVAYDEDFAYIATDDGIFRFNGAEEKNIAEDILNRWTELLDKDNVVLELHGNRLYVFYTPNGAAENSKCFVYNTLYEVWESDDTLGYVGHTHSRDVDNYFLQGSNRVGMVMLGERTTNDWNSMGEPLTFELRTSYYHYETPAQYKRAPVYRPHFETVSGEYAIQVGYATDYSESAQTADVDLSSDGPRFDEGHLFDSGVLFGGVQQVNPMDNSPSIPGEWRRLQLRYAHYAAREPVAFEGHVLALETQRLI